MTTWDLFQSTDIPTRERALEYICDYHKYSETFRDQTQAANDNDDAVLFVYDSRLQDLLFLWFECGQDDILTKLSWKE